MPSEPAARALVDEYGDLLGEVAASAQQARRAFLRAGFEGYVADTVYLPYLDRYVYWPRADADGRLRGWDEPTPGERAALERATDHGFERLGTGASRHVLAAPAPHGALAVKLARVGTTPEYGDGHRVNYRERRYTAAYGDAAPIVACRHVALDGSYAVVDRVEGPSLGDRPDEAALEALRDRLVATVPPLDPPVLSEPENAMWDGSEPVAVDYAHQHEGRVSGLPAHVDARRVVDRVDELRRRGEKRDVSKGGGLVDPAVADDE